MKRRVALGALVVLAGVVSLGALLMWGPVGSTPEALATQWYDLVQGKKEVYVGQVQVDNDRTYLNVRYQPDAGLCLREVHVCVSDQPFTWLPPGNEGKCNDVGGVHFGMEFDVCMDNYVVTIPLAEIGALVDLCPSVNIQAHAVVENECGKQETAYGNEFKASFEHFLCYCPAP